jgi:hypothetical protein
VVLALHDEVEDLLLAGDAHVGVNGLSAESSVRVFGPLDDSPAVLEKLVNGKEGDVTLNLMRLDRDKDAMLDEELDVVLGKGCELWATAVVADRDVVVERRVGDPSQLLTQQLGQQRIVALELLKFVEVDARHVLAVEGSTRRGYESRRLALRMLLVVLGRRSLLGSVWTLFLTDNAGNNRESGRGAKL